MTISKVVPESKLGAEPRWDSGGLSALLCSDGTQDLSTVARREMTHIKAGKALPIAICAPTFGSHLAFLKYNVYR
jgi:hypothetical protein